MNQNIRLDVKGKKSRLSMPLTTTSADPNFCILGIFDGNLSLAIEKLDEGSSDLHSILRTINGSFAIIQWHHSQSATVVTDHAGSIPVYIGISNGNIGVNTKPEKAAAQIGEGSNNIDPVSVADFVVNATVCYPFSLFKNVWMCPPGSVTEVTAKGVYSQSYYIPEEVEPKGSLNDWGRRLYNYVTDALMQATRDAGLVKVLFSGGEDARAVASHMPDSLQLQLVTTADFKNQEVELAEQAASALGKEFFFLQRSPGFYRDYIKERVNCVGSGRDIRHTHFFGETAQPLQNADIIAGGYAADTLFKTTWMGNVKVTRHFLRTIESLEPTYPDYPVGIHKAQNCAWLSTAVAKAVDERRWSHHQHLQEFRPKSAGNWHTLWPMGAQRIAYPHYLSCWQIGTKVVEPFLWTQAYWVAAEMPDAYRLGGKAFQRAFAKGMGAAGWVPTPSGKIPRRDGVRWLTNKIRYRYRSRHYSQNKEQGPWNKDHYCGFDVSVESVLDSERIFLLEEIFKDILTKSGLQKNAPISIINSLPLKERLRAIQVGCIL